MNPLLALWSRSSRASKPKGAKAHHFCVDRGLFRFIFLPRRLGFFGLLLFLERRIGSRQRLFFHLDILKKQSPLAGALFNARTAQEEE